MSNPSGSHPPFSHLLDRFSVWSSFPARYKIFMLIALLAAIALGLFTLLLNLNVPVISNLILFSTNIFLIILMAGLTYLFCIWTATPKTSTLNDYVRFILLALVSYALSTVLIGFFLHLSLTALAGTQATSDLFIFACLIMSIGLVFLARVFSAMDWKRAEDLLFSIVIYSIVIGALFFQSAQTFDLSSAYHVAYIYFITFPWAFAPSIMLSLTMELILRELYVHWKKEEGPAR